MIKLLLQTCVTLLLTLILFGCRQDAQISNVHQSKNWKISNIKAESSRMVYANNLYAVTVDLEIEYSGPNGYVVAPFVALFNEEGEMLESMHNINIPNSNPIEQNMVLWLMSGWRKNPQTCYLETGEGLGMISYQFESSNEPVKLKLSFADIPLLTIHVNNWEDEKEHKDTFSNETKLSIRKETEESNIKGLTEIRSALAICLVDSDGVYPTTLESLIPIYFSKLPPLWKGVTPPSPHVETSESIVYSNRRLKDTGKWAYINNPNNIEHGKVYIDCTHINSEGQSWISQ